MQIYWFQEQDLILVAPLNLIFSHTLNMYLGVYSYFLQPPLNTCLAIRLSTKFKGATLPILKMVYILYTSNTVTKKPVSNGLWVSEIPPVHLVKWKMLSNHTYIRNCTRPIRRLIRAITV